MKTALLQLMEDFLSAIVFVAVFALTGRLLVATAAAIAIALAQFGYRTWRKKPVSTMQWLALGLAVSLGSLTLISQDSRFIRLKPSIAHFVTAAAMLKRGWQQPYLPPIVNEWLPKRMLVGWGYAWAGLMVLMGLANLAAAQWLSIAGWGVVVTGLLIGKLLFFFVQYVSMRVAVRKRMMRAHTTAAAAD